MAAVFVDSPDLRVPQALSSLSSLSSSLSSSSVSARERRMSPKPKVREGPREREKTIFRVKVQRGKGSSKRLCALSLRSSSSPFHKTFALSVPREVVEKDQSEERRRWEERALACGLIEGPEGEWRWMGTHGVVGRVWIKWDHQRDKQDADPRGPRTDPEEIRSGQRMRALRVERMGRDDPQARDAFNLIVSRPSLVSLPSHLPGHSAGVFGLPHGPESPSDHPVDRAFAFLCLIMRVGQ